MEPQTAVVSGSPASSTLQNNRRHEKRLEKKLRERLGKSNSQTRQSAELAAEHIWKVLDSVRESQSLVPRIPSFDMVSLASSVSAASSKEKAMRRGWRRGSREINEADEVLRDVIGDSDLASEYATVVSSASVTENWVEGGLSTPDKKKKGKKGIFSTSSITKKLKAVSRPKDRTSSGDAWMCGVCGQAFATFAAADRHETKHIQQVVSGLGFGSNDLNLANINIFRRSNESPKIASPVNTPNSNQQAHLLQHGFSFEEEEDRKPRAPPSPLPVLREEEVVPNFVATESLPVGTLVPKPRGRSNSEVRFGLQHDPILERQGEEEDTTLLLPSTMVNSAVLGDEALMTVCKRAERHILSPQEIQAERELSLLSSDKAYYDDMAARAVARQVHPTDRYRTDGEGLVGKVQNKLLDAYQIMKEADEGGARTGLTTTDQYNKKRRRRDEGQGTEPDDEIVHTDQTLYVNVMVRNSVQVVNHELERLANQRWEKADDKMENLDHFERFRIYAHLNIVKLAGIALASDFTVREARLHCSVLVVNNFEWETAQPMSFFFTTVNTRNDVAKENRRTAVERCKWNLRESLLTVF
jgi:hypothetical protein